MQNTTHYNLKKPDYTDFADIQDINDNMDTIDEELAAPTGDARDQVVSFTDADLDTGITSFPTFLTKIVSGMKLAKFLRDFKAGMAYVLHVGSLVNNATCTESGKALDARMGKTLQDQITSLNDSLMILNTGTITSSVATIREPYIRCYGQVCMINIDITMTTAMAAWGKIAKVSNGYSSSVAYFGLITNINTGATSRIYIYASDIYTSKALPAGAEYDGVLIYFRV